LASRRGKITVGAMMGILRDHGETGPGWTPSRGLTCFQVCAHPGFGPIRASGTTGSMVSHLAPGACTHFVTATGAPCTGIFKPVWLGCEPRREPAPNGRCDTSTLFWRHEALHRAALRDYPSAIASYRDERDALEKRFVAEALGCGEAGRAGLSLRCFEEADEAEARWFERLPERKRYPGFLYRAAWDRFDRDAELKGPGGRAARSRREERCP
jgi:secernin